MTKGGSPAQLAVRLEALEVCVESARVDDRSVTLPDYPGGPRPSGVVLLSGWGVQGTGENVAFSESEQDRFRTYVARWFEERAAGPRRALVGELSTEGSAYERAALEAALIDLALRQAGLSLFDLTGVREADLRFVVSLAAERDPLAEMRRRRDAGYRGDFKVDVEPSWAPAMASALAKESGIAIFDFKGRADAALARALYAACPGPIFEDPPPDFEEPAHAPGASRVSRDAPILEPASVSVARARGEAVNLKAPRMGGPLNVLRGLERALESRASDEAVIAYLGGMFEVGVGRRQARQLAALYCARAPNDLALNVAEGGSTDPHAQSPARVRFDRPGFG